MLARVTALTALLALLGCESPADPATRDGGALVPLDRAAHCPARDEVLCAEDVGGLFPFAVSGNTLEDGEDGYDGSSCGGGGGAVLDRAYRWTAPFGGRFVITTEGSAFDTVLSLRQGSCGRELVCNDDAQSTGATSELTVDLDECETVTIVVDGGLGATIEGAYVLSIRATEASCDDGVDNDLDGAIDCDDDDCFTARCADPTEDDWPAELSELEWGVLALTNQNRTAGASCDGEAFGPAPELEMDPLLRLSARLHATDMAENDYLEHVSLDGRDLVDRIVETGFTGPGPYGENIARGQPTAEVVVQAWMTSPGHCRNIMNPSFHALGVGLARSSTGEPFWVQNFAGGR